MYYTEIINLPGPGDPNGVKRNSLGLLMAMPFEGARKALGGGG